MPAPNSNGTWQAYLSFQIATLDGLTASNACRVHHSYPGPESRHGGEVRNIKSQYTINAMDVTDRDQPGIMYALADDAQSISESSPC
jgi:hypothetical protein